MLSSQYHIYTNRFEKENKHERTRKQGRSGLLLHPRHRPGRRPRAGPADAAVYLGVRRLEAGQQIADELIAAGGRAGVVFFDASREESFSGMVDEVAAKEGRLDILVNNFGSTDVKTDLDVVNGPSEDFFRIVNTNLKSVYLPSKAAVPLMAKNGGGSIINIGSVGGLYPDLSRTAYGVSKAAIHFLTKDIAVQYARQGVRCNAVLPGFTATDAALNNMSQAFLELFLKNVPLNRPGRPEDIADAVAFLASDRAAFITGEILPVAGGFGLPTPLYGSYMSAGAKG